MNLAALADISWIKPGKVAFLWWNGYVVQGENFSGGMNTATIEHYIDFAAENHIEYVSIDGFDHAWYGGSNQRYAGADITKAVPEVDLPHIFAHAREKGVVRLWMNSKGLRKYMDQALPLYEKWGVEGIMVDFVDHDDQDILNWLHEMIVKAAEHHLTVSIHNTSKPTGMQRTYPNLFTFEAVKNLEYNKWDAKGITPRHDLTVPFSHVAGPLDYHEGGFRSVLPEEFKPRNIAPVVMGTRCHQLGMYVVFEDAHPDGCGLSGSLSWAGWAQTLFARCPRRGMKRAC